MMKMRKKLDEAAESGSFLNGAREIGGVNKDEYANETRPRTVGGQQIQDPSTPLYPHQISNIRENLDNIMVLTIELHKKCVEALQNPSIGEISSKKAVLGKMIEMLDGINETITVRMKKLLENL